jgi:hypothetical protein
MNFKPFFVHYFRSSVKGYNAKERSKPRGFTLYVQPDPTNLRQVRVSGAWCSNKDQFCKKTGRELAVKAEIKSINARKLPDFLVRMQGECKDNEHWPISYDYILRYVV